MKTSKTKTFGNETRRNKRKGGMKTMRYLFGKSDPPIDNELVQIIHNFRKLIICMGNDTSIMGRAKKYTKVISHFINDEDENIKDFLISDIHEVYEIISKNDPEKNYEKFEFEKKKKILKFNKQQRNAMFSGSRLLNISHILSKNEIEILVNSGSITYEDIDEYDRRIGRPIRDNEWSSEVEYLEKMRIFNRKICFELCDKAKINNLLNKSVDESKLINLYKKMEEKYFEKDEVESKSIPINFKEVTDDDLDYIVGQNLDESNHARNSDLSKEFSYLSVSEFRGGCFNCPSRKKNETKKIRNNLNIRKRYGGKNIHVK